MAVRTKPASAGSVMLLDAPINQPLAEPEVETSTVSSPAPPKRNSVPRDAVKLNVSLPEPPSLPSENTRVCVIPEKVASTFELLVGRIGEVPVVAKSLPATSCTATSVAETRSASTLRLL